MKPLSILGAALLLLTTSGTGFGQRKISRSQPVTTEVKTGVNFDCPEDFGYYPHPTDCTQYYVCVFGGALLESCTGGLMYSHELQTCDWPRNVGCDAVGEITVTATASPSTSGRSSEVTRSRYTPPPPPPQPAAVVTSRGQPRQYHHQEIIKQQQQLYEDADEVLPPAEEIESDRQQRVYRGQPSTVGQVQRDRDGLRHTNAIPSYSSRGDKIGVISFGTQQQSQPIQQYRVEVTSVGPSQQPSIATATTRALYNGSQHYDPAHYDPYYSLYEDDVELYRDVDYSQHYNNNNNNNNHNHGHQSFRGTPAPAAQPSPTPEEPKRGNAAYINSYTTQDVYQQPSVPDYNEDNSYNSQVDEQTSYRQSSRQPTRSPVTSKANQTRAQSLPNTLPENPGHTLSSSTPKSLTRRQDASPSNSPFTYRPKLQQDTNTDYSLHSPVVNKPAPFTLPTTKSPKGYHFITKASKSTPVSTAIPTTQKTEQTKRKPNYVRSTTEFTTTTHRLIVPTTYAPPKFFLKSILPKPITTSTYLSSPLNSNTTTDKSLTNSRTEAKGIKAIRKFINPIAINNVFASSTELYPISEEASSQEKITTEFVDRGKVKFPAQSKQEKKESTTHRTTTTTAGTTTSTAKPTTTTTTARTTTTKTTTTTTTTTTTERPVSSTLIEAQSTEKFKHFVEPSSYQRFRNTVEVPHPHQLLVDPEDVAKPEPDQPPTFKPKPPTIPKLTSDAITKTTADSVPRNTSLPARVSRVNAAIKSIIGFGGTRRQNPKCNENQTTNVKCNDLKQRTSNRGRGSAHYSSSNAGSSSSSSSSTGETVNRGTPPTRSRPTLKPSTSIVSKAVEFVDIYRFPPRRPETIYPQPQPDKTAAKCRKDVCLLPDCSCGGKEIPGEMSVEQLPQIVLLTFDDSVNDLNKGLYSDLFEKGRVNPNGCPLSATFYVSHEWTDYSQVQNLYSDGHEMASHTVSHSFGEQFSQKKWTREIAGQREILSAYGGVKLEDVRGMRAPFLSVGGNKMFKMLYDSNFTYDSSMPIYENKPPSWPYTLDYKLFHDCMIPPCPTRSYPGVWEVPMVMWQDLNGGRCSMGDACSNPADSDGVFKMIMKNFDRHYTTNRAPFGLFYHAAWFTQPHHKEGFIKFMDTVNKMKDVFFVTNWQAIQWVRDPTPMSRINQFQPFQCNYSDRPKRCNNPKVCNLWHKSGVRYMRTCQPCPDIYPWTGNSGIRSSRIDNDIED
ncbi:PREDICTED: mucin-5AC isoform X2 [Nicrophorus vespilloides]|uniref:Mucin-5AC isoform X2 n=1 Tax=Nicrophorus vespilloides TaxID=110193 RepID=A0ABM1MPG7_NICVS|nr:PREDICTED: mucin-5AC isoform X2 [Nicrophorus vespilloides]